jgi:hypothetical protein
MSPEERLPARGLLLTAGGPTYRIQKRLGLIHENSPRIVRRAFLAILMTWVPLLALSALQGNAIGHRIAVPFLRDFAVHARFLLAVPLLLFAETILGPHLAHAAAHFITSGVVGKEDYVKFDKAIESGLNSRDSTTAEVLLVLLAYVIGGLTLWSMAVHVSTWYAIRTNSGVSLTLAGWWFLLFCVPLFQFLTMRWLWRHFLWGQFLWRMSRLNLKVIPTHPDQAAGLAFVGDAQRFFAIVLLAFSIAVAGVLADAVVYDKLPFPHFGIAVATYLVIAIGIVLAPLLVFAPLMIKTKRTGLHKYGTFATTYTAEFQSKWITPSTLSQDTLLGTPDIRSLADLGNSFSLIEEMNPLPMRPRTPIHLALACLIPMAPLLLTVMPLGEIVKLLLKAIG